MFSLVIMSAIQKDVKDLIYGRVPPTKRKPLALWQSAFKYRHSICLKRFPFSQSSTFALGIMKDIFINFSLSKDQGLKIKFNGVVSAVRAKRAIKNVYPILTLTRLVGVYFSKKSFVVSLVQRKRTYVSGFWNKYERSDR